MKLAFDLPNTVEFNLRLQDFDILITLFQYRNRCSLQLLLLSLYTCTLVTGDLKELVREIHTRMPVILPEEHHEIWLAGEADKAILTPRKRATAVTIITSTGSRSTESESAFFRSEAEAREELKKCGTFASYV